MTTSKEPVFTNSLTDIEQLPSVLQLSYDVNNPPIVDLNAMSKAELIKTIKALYMDVSNCCGIIRKTDNKCNSNYEQYRKHLNIVQYSYARLQKEHSKEKIKLHKKLKQNSCILLSVPENKIFDEKVQSKTQETNNWLVNININPQKQTKDLLINKYISELAQLKQSLQTSHSKVARLTCENIQSEYTIKNTETINVSLNDRLSHLLQNEKLVQKNVNELNAALGESEARCAQLQDTKQFTKGEDINVETLNGEGCLDIEREMLNKCQHLEECISHNMQLQAQMQASDIKKKCLERDIEQYRRSLSDCRQNNVQLQTNLQQLMMQIMYNWSQFRSQTPSENDSQNDQNYQFQFM